MGLFSMTGVIHMFGAIIISTDLPILGLAVCLPCVIFIIAGTIFALVKRVRDSNPLRLEKAKSNR